MRMLASAVSPATVQVAWLQSLYVFSDVCCNQIIGECVVLLMLNYCVGMRRSDMWHCLLDMSK